MQATRDRYLRIIADETDRLERSAATSSIWRRRRWGGAMQPEDVSVRALFDRVHARHEREVTARGISLTDRIAPGAESVYGDPDRLEQVLQNLAANALRYTPDGGAISLSAEIVNDAMRIIVRDNGPGIEPGHLPLIFDRFFKPTPRALPSAAADSACPSSRPSSSGTAARSRRITTVARYSRSCSPLPTAPCRRTRISVTRAEPDPAGAGPQSILLV
jgi:hypothetical protein